MCKLGKTPILAVDADANSNLNEVLGVDVEMTLGEVREQIERAETSSQNPIPSGMSKADYAEIMFQRCLNEDDDFDLLVMGRTQGKGCYCYVNGILTGTDAEASSTLSVHGRGQRGRDGAYQPRYSAEGGHTDSRQ